MFQRIIDKFRGRFLQNVCALYGVQAANIIIPLINIPYLARVLSPGPWGVVLFCQAYGLYLGILVQYGFNTAAAREIARGEASSDGVKGLAAGILGAKIVLCLIAVLLSLVVQRFVPTFRNNSLTFYSAVAWGLSQGLTLIWYFQGTESLRLTSVVEILCKALAVAATFILVHKSSDGWMVLFLLAISSFLSLLIMGSVMYRTVGFQIPTIRLTCEAIRLSWTRFLFELTSTLYTTSGTLFVGFFAAPAIVAYYNNAERLIRTARVSLDPVIRVAFPRVTSLTQTSHYHASRFTMRLIWILGVLSSAIALVLFFGSPLLVHVIFGKGYGSIVPTLRILSCIPPIYTITMVLGYVWAYPLGFDVEVTRVMGIAAVLNAVLAVALVPRFGANGMAAAVVAVNIYVLLAHVRMLQIAGQLPWAMATLPENAAHILTNQADEAVVSS